MVKKIAIYGSYTAKVPVRQRYWKKRKDGVRQRYWKRTRQLRKETLSGRYEFHGTGRELYKAVAFAHRYMPKGFVDVSADGFTQHPEQYGLEGQWIEHDIES